ncbi:hypothetical protein P8935_23360 [Telmatobacter sp. DSM 110680]|uniref:DUF3592 domain-containing protein n=1 Tax=Telmatobacter sp. DSM 110680 TaxID=3036704 RepID=A0AAU7DJI3_9BACT
MLIEFWERLRGYDKWPETEATIISGQKVRRALRLRDPKLNRVSADMLVWKDQYARKHYGAFVTYDTSALYQLLEGESILIRYDPSRPNRYYNRSLFVAWLIHLTKAAIAISVFLAALVWRIWMIVTRRG